MLQNNTLKTRNTYIDWIPCTLSTFASLEKVRKGAEPREKVLKVEPRGMILRGAEPREMSS